MDTPLQFQKLKAYYSQLIPGLTDESWQICEDILTIRTFKKGDIILKAGVMCNQVSFINHGLIRMYYDFDGREKITEFFKEGDYTGDYRSFLIREPALTYLQALEDTEVVDTTYDDLQMIYKCVPEANRLGRLIAEELFIDMCLKSTAQAGGNIDEQYQNLVIEKPWLVQRVPQYMIASYLGITPEALSRIKARASKKKVKKELVY